MAFLRSTITKMFNTNGYQKKMSPKNVALITGCDSGLGYSLALFCHSLNMTVVSACHNTDSTGANLLRKLNDPKRMIIIEVDLLKRETMKNARDCMKKIIQTNEGYELTAIVNNAGVMCFGEFEWQTFSQIEMQINVNLLGTMFMTKEMLPLIREHRGRIINITSHCGLNALPTLAPYAASKAGLRFFTDSLRVEMNQYGVKVVNFIPGSFVLASNIAARQQEHANEMMNAFNSEQMSFYSQYFKEFNNYLAVISGFKPLKQIEDDGLLNKFQDALTNTDPKALYLHEPLRYKVYRLLFNICPTWIVDWLTVKFCDLPRYQPVLTQKSLTINSSSVQNSIKIK